jgi:GNAT superfamily N-acetyltransferase
MTQRAYRGRGYAGALLEKLIETYPWDTLECYNVNKHLTDALVRNGFKQTHDKYDRCYLPPRKR